ncbi:hypothetical protein O6H91_10G057500 [Diphasiastrum complanatum]|uniref:Uncharacterized protein n=1 Tax=Diphasiastrum complanatum TaxID=34168 RepID=A0ACC2CH88_DIPCM|nr:hypothetical protein O6H91_10G057500 [Diphasiastrum complanatum]
MAEEVLSLEQELEQQLVEHRASLVTLDEALLLDSSNEELLSVREELLLAVKGGEESLLHLKRSRLLREIDLLSQSHVATGIKEHVEDTAVNITFDTNQVPSNDELHILESEDFFVGSKCRFRYTNGRWYNGEVIAIEEDGVARLSFLTPTDERMQICRFYLQQRCRFGGSCRSSHGVLVELRALRKFLPCNWHETSVGSTVLACISGSFGLWRYAELEMWDEKSGKGQVVFVDDGRRAEVDIDSLASSEHAEASDESSTSSEDDEDDTIVPVEDIAYPSSLGGAMNITESIQQMEVTPFAKWEKHTRGMASKMMSSMGYRAGMGLGVSGQGIIAPIQVSVLPAKQSLDCIWDSTEDGKVDGDTKSAVSRKKKRGGKRSRDKKHAAAARQAKLEEERVPDVFSFINNQLASQKGSHDVIGTSKRGEHKETAVQSTGVKSKRSKEDHRSLFQHEDEVIEIRSKVSRLEEMAHRNRKEKAVYDAVRFKLDEARKALTVAESTHLAATQAVHKKEQESKWLRF